MLRRRREKKVGNEFPLQVAPPLICCLTFSPLPLLHDGLQPLLFLLRGFGHADEPLVLGCVVDLPAVVHDVPTAVVVSCGGKGVESSGSIWLALIKTSAHEGRNIFGQIREFCFWQEGPSVCGHIDHDAVNRCWKPTLQLNRCSKMHDRWFGLIQDRKKRQNLTQEGASKVPARFRLTHPALVWS